MKYNGVTNVEAIVSDTLDFIKANETTFTFLLLMETHTPMYDGNKVKIPYPIQNPKSVFQFQKGAVEFVDEKIGVLLDAIRESGKPTDIIITADHGELIGRHV